MRIPLYSGARMKKPLRSYASESVARRPGLRIVAMGDLIDIDRSHVGKVDRDRSLVSRGHYLERLYHMLEPAIDFLVGSALNLTKH